jgi:dienelactone hydrolase
MGTLKGYEKRGKFFNHRSSNTQKDQDMNTDIIDYTDGDLICEAYVAYDGSQTTKSPCVLISHQWAGQSDHERAKARQLAELGYVGVAIDVYGKGVRGGVGADNSKLIEPLMSDRALLRRRVNAAFSFAKGLTMVDANRIGAMGYCFGGLCVLDLARSNPSGLKGVVSFHGLLIPPKLGPQATITSKILILHGYDDPLAPPDHVVAIGQELTQAKADWQLHAYGGVMHAFTAQGMNKPDNGLVYHEAANRRSWVSAKNFFEEIFA